MTMPIGQDPAFPRRGGRARRLIDLKRWDDETVVGWLEDDFHHFGVTVIHANGKVKGVSMAAVRYPYSSCPSAKNPLQALVGCPLVERSSDVGEFIDMRHQCTHVHDLTGLVLAHAWSGRDHRRYEAAVDDREIIAWEPGYRRLLGKGTATLRQDDAEVLAWELDGRTIVGPDVWAGQSLSEGFRRRTEAMPVEAAEHATVLRRAILIASGRTLDMDVFPMAADRGLSGMCHTFQPEQLLYAKREYGSTRNFEVSGAGMLSHVGEKP